MLTIEPIEIRSRDFWVKVVDFLQQNWALVDDVPSGARVWFIHDCSGVFDGLDFGDRQSAERALRRNGFDRFRTEAGAPSPPQPPFVRDEHPNGPIYSSGRFWR